MVAKPKPNKREAILNAMLDVVAERGFHEAPMSLVSERSGASAGVKMRFVLDSRFVASARPMNRRRP